METLSGLQRLVECPASARLPHVALPETAYSYRGDVQHLFLRDCSLVGRDTALERVPAEHRKGCEHIEVGELPVDPQRFAVEVALAYDWRTDGARELHRNGDRDYSAALLPEICGTVDVLGLTDREVIVFDYKTGRKATLRTARLQLLGYAVAAARAYGRKRAIIGVVRLRDDGSAWLETESIGPMQLDAAAELIRATMENIAQSQRAEELPMAEGDWCTYCEAFTRCPAKTSLARGFMRDPPTLELIELNEFSIPGIWNALDRAREVINRVEAAVCDAVTVRPVPMGDGTVLGPVDDSREFIVPEIAEKVLREDVYEDALEKKYTITKEALREALRKRLEPGEKITHVQRATIEQLRAANAMQVKKTTKVKVHKPKALPAGDQAEQ